MNNIKQIVKKSGSSFFWSMRFLPKAKRNAMYTIYAFCRHLDDVVDGEAAMEEKLELINAWREELDNIYDKKAPITDIGRKIYKNCMRFKLPKAKLAELIDAISMDIPTPIRAPQIEELYRYCRGVAGVPGSLSLRIFGCKDEQLINKLSDSLGTALQLTNILRDVKEDAQAGRLYLPKELLLKAGIQSEDPLTVVVDKNLAVAREELARIALNNFTIADSLIKQLDKTSSRPVRMIERIYRRYFDIMQKRGWEIISPKPRVSKLQKLSIALRAYFNFK
ncbi:MAG: squalene/phytoene synthase family protein [Alphaproteobacteria bacterium]|nr:squalene/phytoene synthase family protein [Alphaproteobacteria bacterium]